MENYILPSTSSTQHAILQIIRGHSEVIINSMTVDEIRITVASTEHATLYQKLIDEIHNQLDVTQEQLRY